jgi:hypothetical protein
MCNPAKAKTLCQLPLEIRSLMMNLALGRLHFYCVEALRKGIEILLVGGISLTRYGLRALASVFVGGTSTR